MNQFFETVLASKKEALAFLVTLLMLVCFVACWFISFGFSSNSCLELIDVFGISLALTALRHSLYSNLSV